MKKIERLEITESTIRLIARSGCRFDGEAAQKGVFSVIINKDTEAEYEISYTAAVNEAGNVLTIRLDKSYPAEDVGTIDISYGAK